MKQQYLPQLIGALLGVIGVSSIHAAPHTTSWALDMGRNMVREAQNVPTQFTEENLVWEIDSGTSNQYPMPVIVGDKVLIGGDAAGPDPFWDKAFKKGGTLVCRQLRTGEELWRLIAPESSRPGVFGVCGPPIVMGDVVYVLSAQDMYCLDLNGLANGNQGMQEELKLMTRRPFEVPEGEQKPTELPAWAADVLWHYTWRDMNIQVQDAISCTPVIVDGQVWISTANEMGSEARGNLNKKTGQYEPPEMKPHMLVVDAKTGRLIAYDKMEVPIIFHGEWSSPALVEVNGEKTVIFGDGYGVLHGFALPTPSPDGEPVVLEEYWTLDLNPPEYRYDDQGRRHPYTLDLRLDYKYPLSWPEDETKWIQLDTKKRFLGSGPGEIIAMPCVVGNRVYLALGRDEHYDGGGMEPPHRELPKGPKRRFGQGRMMCLEFADVKQPPRVAWEDRDVARTQSTASVYDGLVYLVDFAGYLNCWDAETGESIYKFDVGASVKERSQLVTDGKVYVCNNIGFLQVIKAGREPELISSTRFKHHLSTVEVADGLLLAVSPRDAFLYHSK